MTDQDQFAAFVVDGSLRSFLQVANDLAKLVGRKLLFDRVPQFDLLPARRF